MEGAKAAGNRAKTAEVERKKLHDQMIKEILAGNQAKASALQAQIDAKIAEFRQHMQDFNTLIELHNALRDREKELWVEATQLLDRLNALDCSQGADDGGQTPLDNQVASDDLLLQQAVAQGVANLMASIEAHNQNLGEFNEYLQELDEAELGFDPSSLDHLYIPVVII